MRRKIAYIAAVIALPVFMAVTSCGHTEDSVNLIFNQVKGECATTNESAATIQCDGGLVTFEGSILTPNPCYYLKPNTDLSNKSNVVIVITSVSGLINDSYCTECVGEISFDGTVELSGACSRMLSIVYNGATIAEYERK
jgi:hypothetical protein